MICIKDFESKFNFNCLFLTKTAQNHLGLKTTKRTDDLTVNVSGM